jgi:putative hemolysin
MARALALRQVCFRSARGQAGPEADRFDPVCQHYLIESDGQPQATFRVMVFSNGAGLDRSYAAQFYDLARLAAYPAPVLELGRFCLHPKASHPADTLRLAWAALTRLVDAHGVRLLVGCTSFEGADPTRHAAALALLRAYPAPDALLPGPRANVIPLPESPPDFAGSVSLPPLLRSYLAMGGWVSSHAVLDPDLDTLHVFTGLEVDRIPAARARALRALAAELPEAAVMGQA